MQFSKKSFGIRYTWGDHSKKGFENLDNVKTHWIYMLNPFKQVLQKYHPLLLKWHWTTYNPSCYLQLGAFD
jgi:hypothetical protein